MSIHLVQKHTQDHKASAEYPLRTDLIFDSLNVLLQALQLVFDILQVSQYRREVTSTSIRGWRRGW
jgi:hypothetical protein